MFSLLASGIPHSTCHVKVLGEIRFCNKCNNLKSRVITGKTKSWRKNKAAIQNQMACVSPPPASPWQREGWALSPWGSCHTSHCVSSYSFPWLEAEMGGHLAGFCVLKCRVNHVIRVCVCVHMCPEFMALPPSLGVVGPSLTCSKYSVWHIWTVLNWNPLCKISLFNPSVSFSVFSFHDEWLTT